MTVRKRQRPIIRAVRAHPVLTWGTIAAIVSVLGGLGAFALWLDARWQTKQEARLHSERDEQNRAWLIYGQSKTNVILLRNRLNDCNAKRTDRTLTRGEAGPCEQYKQEYEEEVARSRDLYGKAMLTSK